MAPMPTHSQTAGRLAVERRLDAATRPFAWWGSFSLPTPACGARFLMRPVLHLARDQEGQFHRLFVIQARVDFASRTREPGRLRWDPASRQDTPSHSLR